MEFQYRSSRRGFLRATAALAVAGTLGRGRVAQAAEQDLIVRTAEPYNAEPPLIALVADQVTPVKHFYVRNHGPTPKVELNEYKVRVEGMVERPLELSVAELKDRFRQLTAEATLTCAGNRRQEMSAIKPVGGVQWDAGAIGHARWTGATLAEVLRVARIKAGAKHVWFEGLDPIKEKDGSVAPFGGSVPLEKRPNESVLLAHAMNDEPLTAEHGFPLRVVAPGFIGARSVKWLSKITVSDRPSPNHYVAEAYKLIQTEAKDEVAGAKPIYAFPINAAICAPASGAKVKAGRTTIGGYALPEGGEVPGLIEKVEVSGDGGRNWTTAKFFGDAPAFSWRQWTAELDLPLGKHELVVRAADSRGNTMPEKCDWNFKGYLYNGWHRVAVEAV
jgi:sulfite oxidase